MFTTGCIQSLDWTTGLPLKFFEISALYLVFWCHIRMLDDNVTMLNPIIWLILLVIQWPTLYICYRV